MLGRSSPLAPRHATFARLRVGAGRASVGDHVVATFFPAPHSFTTEDTVEISAHGSPVLDSRRMRAPRRPAGGAWRVHVSRVRSRQDRADAGRSGRRPGGGGHAVAGPNGLRPAGRVARNGDLRPERDTARSHRAARGLPGLPGRGLPFHRPRRDPARGRTPARRRARPARASRRGSGDPGGASRSRGRSTPGNRASSTSWRGSTARSWRTLRVPREIYWWNRSILAASP